jgi:hypothetical protein
MLGAPVTKPLRFDLQFSLSAASPFSRALTLLRNELKDPAGLTTVPAMSRQLGRVIMTGLLVSQTHNYTEALTRPRAVPGSKPIRNALELIESQPADIESVTDIAAAVGLSVRALDDGFHRPCGTPCRRLGADHGKRRGAQVGFRPLWPLRRRVRAPVRPKALRDATHPALTYPTRIQD